MRKELELNQEEQKVIDETINHWKETCFFRDPEVQSFEEKFLKIAFLMDGDEQEKCTKLYCKYIAGVVVPKKWRQWQNREWLSQVGRNLNGGGERPSENGIVFWQELQKTIPGTFSEEELAWLVKNDPRGGGGSCLIFNMSRAHKSALPVMVEVSILAWK